MNPDPPAVRELGVPDEHPCFADHFPGQPILPGALLLQWICQGLEAQFTGRRVVAVKSMKFHQTLAPGDRCQLHIDPGSSSRLVKVRLQRLQTLVCQGVLEWDDDSP